VTPRPPLTLLFMAICGTARITTRDCHKRRWG
jgi:hypothetical protein